MVISKFLRAQVANLYIKLINQKRRLKFQSFVENCSTSSLLAVYQGALTV